MSNYKYIEYKFKYLNLRNKINKIQFGGNNKNLIYTKKIKNTPTEYLQNILFIIITNQGLNLKNIYIDYIPEPVEHNKSSPTTINVNIYSLEVTIDKTKLDNLKMKLDEALNKFSI